MALASENCRNNYAGDGTDHVFPYTFKVFVENELRVVVRDTEGVETLLKKTTDYTVTGVGSRDGGDITLVNQVQGLVDEYGNPYESPTQPWLDVDGELKTGYFLTVRRLRGLTQGTSIRNLGAFYPGVHEDTFDQLVMNDQQQRDDILRAIKLPETFNIEDFDPALPGDLPGSSYHTIVSNEDGTGFELGPTAHEILNAETFSQEAEASKDEAKEWAIKTDDFVGDTAENSAKAYAVGGTGDGQPIDGDAKSWAQKTDGEVVPGEYSSKEHAVGNQTRGVAGGGSAKDWASYIGGTVDDTYYSARHYAEQAAGNESISASKEDVILNNQTTWANISEFSVDATIFSSARFFLEIHRFTDSMAHLSGTRNALPLVAISFSTSKRRMELPRFSTKHQVFRARTIKGRLNSGG